jgi:hypothetical protein
VDGQQRGIDLGNYARLEAEMGKIGGEAVADVDGGGGQAVPDEPKTLTNAGLRVEVRSQLGVQLPGNSEWDGAGGPGSSQLGNPVKGGGRSSEAAGDVEVVAGARSGAEQGLSLRNAADENNIGNRDGRLGEVAAGQRSLVSGGEGQEAVEKGVHPG